MTGGSILVLFRRNYGFSSSHVAFRLIVKWAKAGGSICDVLITIGFNAFSSLQ